MTDDLHLYRSLVDHIRDPIFVLDLDRQIVFANSAASNAFGLTLIGTNFVRIFRNPICLAAINEVIDGAKAKRVKFSQDGLYRIHYELRVAPIELPATSKRLIMVALADISHVYEARQMRSDFVANVSHELRSPLTALSGFIETLQGPAKNDKAATERFLDLMSAEARRMVRLIQDLLSLSKVEANQRIRPDGEVEISLVIQRLMKTLSTIAEKERKTLKLEMEKDGLRVVGSDDELTQVFQNLMENAIKYAKPDTEVLITIKEISNAPGMNGDTISVTVQDWGEGIPREHIPRLTERFYRVDTHRSRDKGGTGLGLAIVKHIVGRHRGRLLIDSEVGVGSTFKVLLPRHS